ncbi:hypothetical protein [Neobacillus niacini]|uniref:hypothetical protein n=1 Tax=Neobacillus niacini TaxID=86668 RepID=UPI0021CAF36F|nr:hypothetical protein [Neobacillus niacini]MCM3768249.1 hypothetical protein [Neobacillus niacini]
MVNFHNKIFISTTNQDKGGSTSETTFYFKQNKNIVKATYNGRNIVYGELIGMFNDQGVLKAAFNQLNAASQFVGGTCILRPMEKTLRGVWTYAGENTVEKELILEEL